MKITIDPDTDLSDPRSRVLAVEGACQAICEAVGQDAADGMMMLLTAAAHIAMKNTKKSIPQTATLLAESLGYALVAAEDFFKLREVVSESRP